MSWTPVAYSQIATPTPGWAVEARAASSITSRSANVMGCVLKTTACGGPCGERANPRYCS